MKTTINIFWFRRDLRLDDNCGLFNALSSDKKVLPIFIFDEDILNKLPTDDSRVSFLHQELENIQQQLLKMNSSISVFHGKPMEIFKDLSEKYTIDTVFTNHDYEPYALQRDLEISSFLESKDSSFKTFKDQVIFERDEIVKKDGTPYKVYTPYSKKWLEAFELQGIEFFPSEEKLENFIKNETIQFLSLEEIGFKTSSIKVASYKVDATLIDTYEETRNFPAKNSTSRLGTHLRFGTVSVRKMVDKGSKSNNITFLKELIWREFFMQILWHFPHTTKDSFKPQYDRILWRNNEEEFKAWCQGKTGYPLVDAGMRELNQTGFMHNRVRMLVGSFLCKHLLIDWRWGEAYFAEKLHDYEQSSNIGNWQWVAGTGVDASPYFRIFNPTTQILKFDKKLEYIKKWVPDFQEFTYSKEIVDHKIARERCLKTYKAALQEF
ncbi:cryptochrome/photolyase family protein [Polaribacter glomeratus]|uniref:Deoxyribodipyrimidine photolyase n=1 Tax=Polaribacter glomeratus TaxID=102 RepID=A0A2S7WU79_9FLAO|nr:deoxyribodipyrimidine photo-lyase [Polaribacter glomeratus]PQJ81138.1 deoxyribodipyrimidine photolyase [Polaribacter glomeratus]TXD65690.1 deoxyribodipyrimidine photo-lyase [Polaribacter glomeratus]